MALLIVNIDWCFIGTVMSTTNTSYYYLWMCVCFSFGVFFSWLSFFLVFSRCLSLSSSLLPILCRVKLIIWLFLCCLYFLFIPPLHFIHIFPLCSAFIHTSVHFKWVWCKKLNNNNNTNYENNTNLNHNLF